MAGQFYGYNRGQLDVPSEVLTSTSTTGANIEVQIVSGFGVTIKDVVLAFNTILQRLEGQNLNGTPPTL